MQCIPADSLCKNLHPELMHKKWSGNEVSEAEKGSPRVPNNNAEVKPTISWINKLGKEKVHYNVCVCVCVCILFPHFSSFSLCLAVAYLLTSWRAAGSLSPSLLPPSSSSLSVALPVVGCAPSSLLPPCSLIPPSPSLFGCHLVSYVRGMGGEWLWRLGAIRQTSRRSLALPRVCVVAALECFHH